MAMSDERLAEIRRHLVAPYSGSNPLVDGWDSEEEAMLYEVINEGDRLRAELAAALDIVRTVAYDDPIQPESDGGVSCHYCGAGASVEAAVSHTATCAYIGALALLWLDDDGRRLRDGRAAGEREGEARR